MSYPRPLEERLPIWDPEFPAIQQPQQLCLYHRSLKSFRPSGKSRASLSAVRGHRRSSTRFGKCRKWRVASRRSLIAWSFRDQGTFLVTNVFTALYTETRAHAGGRPRVGRSGPDSDHWRWACCGSGCRGGGRRPADGYIPGAAWRHHVVMATGCQQADEADEQNAGRLVGGACRSFRHLAVIRRHECQAGRRGLPCCRMPAARLRSLVTVQDGCRGSVPAVMRGLSAGSCRHAPIWTFLRR